MPASRSVYRMPPTEIANGDPHLTVDWQNAETIENGGNIGTFGVIGMSGLNGSHPNLDAQSEVGLISPKPHSLTASISQICQRNRNKILIGVGVFLLFASVYVAGYMTRRTFVPMGDYVGNTYEDVEYSVGNVSKVLLCGYNSEVDARLEKVIKRPEELANDIEALVKSPGSHWAGKNNGVAQRIKDRFDMMNSSMMTMTMEHRVLLSLPDFLPAKSAVISGSESIFQANTMAYSPTAEVTGKLVFADYGSAEAFKNLTGLLGSLNGTIALVRFGRTPRSLKVANAARYGCAGVIMYADEDQQRKAMYGTILSHDMAPFVVEPVPESMSAPEYTQKLRDAKRLPTIPAVFISSETAKKLIDELNKADVSSKTIDPAWSWKSAFTAPFMGFPTRVGPTVAEITLKASTEMKFDNIKNVAAIMRGTLEPDRFVLVATHHDSWGPGAADPYSGTAAMIGIAEGLGKLNRTDKWQPRRSIMFVSFDAEELGMLGSAAFVRRFMVEIEAGMFVASVGLDAAVRGQYVPYVRADPMLRGLLRQSAKVFKPIDDKDKDVLNMYDLWYKRSDKYGNERDRLDKVPPVAQLDTKSDDARLAFFGGIPAVTLQFYHDMSDRTYADYPTYHTDDDTLENYKTKIDPGFKALAMVVHMGADAVLRLADSLYIPYNCSETAYYINEALKTLNVDLYVDNVKNMMDALKENAASFASACNSFNTKDSTDQETIRKGICESKNGTSGVWHYAALRRRNDLLSLVSQAFVRQPFRSAPLDIQYAEDPYFQLNRSTYEIPQHSSTIMRHVLLPPGLHEQGPKSTPRFFSLTPALNAYRDSKTNGANTQQQKYLEDVIVHEFRRAIDSVISATELLNRQNEFGVWVPALKPLKRT